VLLLNFLLKQKAHEEAYKIALELHKDLNILQMSDDGTNSAKPLDSDPLLDLPPQPYKFSIKGNVEKWVHCHNTLISMHAKEGNTDGILSVLTMMTREGNLCERKRIALKLYPNRITFQSLVDGIRSSLLPNSRLQFLTSLVDRIHSLPKDSFTPTATFYWSLLPLYVELEDIEGACTMMEHMQKAKDFHSELYLTSNVMGVFQKLEGKKVMIQKVFQETRDFWTNPDYDRSHDDYLDRPMISRNSGIRAMFGGLCDCNLIKEAIRFYEMKNEIPFILNDTLRNKFLHMLYSANMMDEFESVILDCRISAKLKNIQNEFGFDGPLPTSTYATLITAFAEKNDEKVRK
jgi:pentatricopeptide repeat protein